MEQKNKSTPGQQQLMDVYASIRDMLPESNRSTWQNGTDKGTPTGELVEGEVEN